MRRSPRHSFIRSVLLPALALALASLAGCGGRPYAEGGSRELTVLTRLPRDAPELMLLQAIVEREAIRIEDERVYQVRVAPPESARAYRARSVICLGYGEDRDVPQPFQSLLPLLRKEGVGYVFVPDIWLRGQAVGLIWARTLEDLSTILQHDQNRLFHTLDRTVYGTVRARVLSLPRDGEAETHLHEVLGVTMRVPRGYTLRIDRMLPGACLVDEGPPARLLRIWSVHPGAPEGELSAARERLARAFRPGERTLPILEPVLASTEMTGSLRQLYGRWEDVEASAAGPYRFFEVSRGGRRYYVDLAVFAPGRPKLPYLRELQAIAETLQQP